MISGQSLTMASVLELISFEYRPIHISFDSGLPLRFIIDYMKCLYAV